MPHFGHLNFAALWIMSPRTPCSISSSVPAVTTSARQYGASSALGALLAAEGAATYQLRPLLTMRR
jgi:hypothetical protein